MKFERKFFVSFAHNFRRVNVNSLYSVYLEQVQKNRLGLETCLLTCTKYFVYLIYVFVNKGFLRKTRRRTTSSSFSMES